MGSSDSESEDERRVVRSAKDKAQEELRAVCNDIKVGTHVWPATLLVSVPPMSLHLSRHVPMHNS
jgi:hypothetical protein